MPRLFQHIIDRAVCLTGRHAGIALADAEDGSGDVSGRVEYGWRRCVPPEGLPYAGSGKLSRKDAGYGETAP